MKQKDSLREFTRQAKIHVYTRPVDPDCYPAGLANSVHLSCMAENAQPVPFNKNYGILFALYMLIGLIGIPVFSGCRMVKSESAANEFSKTEKPIHPAPENCSFGQRET